MDNLVPFFTKTTTTPWLIHHPTQNKISQIFLHLCTLVHHVTPTETPSPPLWKKKPPSRRQKKKEPTNPNISRLFLGVLLEIKVSILDFSSPSTCHPVSPGIFFLHFPRVGREKKGKQVGWFNARNATKNEKVFHIVPPVVFIPSVTQ